jgi:hypothetical protein
MLQVTPLDQLISEAEAIQEFLDEPSPDDINLIYSRGSELQSYMSRTGKMKSDAKFHYETKKRSTIMEEIIGLGEALKLPPSTINKLVDSSCATESSVLEWCSRLNATATHQLDYLRSLISMEKEQLRLSGGMNNQSNY